MSTVINILKILAIVYVAILILMYFFQEKLIFFAQPIANPYVNRFTEHEITFEHDDVKLHGWFVRKDITAETPLIIYYGGNAEEVSGNLLDLKSYPDSAILFMNYRGYGKSEGKPSEKKLVSDALFILDEIVQKEKIDLQHVVLLGRSLGSGVATQVAYQRKVGGVILITPFDSLANVAKSHYPVFPVKLLVRHPFESERYAKDIGIPALNIMGSADRIIPNRHSKALAKAWKGEIETVLIQQADHNNIQLFPQYWQSINRFLDSLDRQE